MTFNLASSANQLSHPGGSTKVPGWMKAQDSKDGTCFVQGQGDLIYYHRRLPRGHILFLVGKDKKINSLGEIIEPCRMIAVFR